MKLKINGYIVSNEWKPVYDFYGVESCCPNDITLAVTGKENELLEIEIGTCYGGDIFAGSEIGAAIKAHKGGASISILGLAASAASILAMYAPNEMSPTAMMMVHNVSSMAEGDYRIMSKESDTLKQCNKAMSAAYVMKSGMPEAEALKMMNDETWLTAAQAKERGLIDRIMFDSSTLVASVGPGMIPKSVIDKTLKMLADKKATEQIDNTAMTIARAKLSLIEKTM